MSARGRRFVRGALAFAVLLSGGSALAVLAGLRWNLSPSLPRGIYREARIVMTRGQVVLACPPSGMATLFRTRGYLGAGDCAGGVAPLGKPIAAVAGQVVEVRRDGVWIDGVRVPRSRPWLQDSLGRPLPSLVGRRFVIASHQVFLLSTHHSRSLDSRVFGPLEIGSVRAGLIPLLVERKKRNHHES